MTRTFTIKQGQKPTDEQLQEVMEAKKHPIVFDEDSPQSLGISYFDEDSPESTNNLETIKTLRGFVLLNVWADRDIV